MPIASATRSLPRVHSPNRPSSSVRRMDAALSIAEQQGLFAGGRTLTLRGRMPSLLVERAKKKTGIQSDSKLIEMALANIAVADDYADWLLAQSGTIDKGLDLEF